MADSFSIFILGHLSLKYVLILKSNYLIHSLKNLQQPNHLTQQLLLRSPLRGSLHPAYAVSIPQIFNSIFRIAILRKSDYGFWMCRIWDLDFGFCDYGNWMCQIEILWSRKLIWPDEVCGKYFSKNANAEKWFPFSFCFFSASLSSKF